MTTKVGNPGLLNFLFLQPGAGHFDGADFADGGHAGGVSTDH